MCVCIIFYPWFYIVSIPKNIDKSVETERETLRWKKDGFVQTYTNLHIQTYTNLY